MSATSWKFLQLRFMSAVLISLLRLGSRMSAPVYVDDLRIEIDGLIDEERRA